MSIRGQKIAFLEKHTNAVLKFTKRNTVNVCLLVTVCGIFTVLPIFTRLSCGAEELMPLGVEIITR
ncbi:MAG: hypothetical protein LBK06_05520 [Planctomycetaceae bacterium]|nr:hypothetical protein [Planctomycetaceae bacterium]